MKLDAIILPGFGCSAVKKGYGRYLTPCATYTYIWNLLNVPVGYRKYFNS